MQNIDKTSLLITTEMIRRELAYQLTGKLRRPLNEIYAKCEVDLMHDNRNDLYELTLAYETFVYRKQKLSREDLEWPLDKFSHFYINPVAEKISRELKVVIKAPMYLIASCPDCRVPMQRTEDDSRVFCSNTQCRLLGKQYHAPRIELIEVSEVSEVSDK